MCQHILYIFLPSIQELFVVQQIAQPGESVQIVGCLLEAPPIGPAAF